MAPPWLTSRREVDVLEQVAHGLSNRAAADVLGISMKAVEKYVSSIFRKLGLVDHRLVDRRVNAALAFLRTESNPFSPLLDPRHRDHDQPAVGVDTANRYPRRSGREPPR